MLTQHVALVSEESSITVSELTQVAAALQKQVSRDFGPIWGVDATISAFAMLEDLPLDYWPIIIKDDVGTAAPGFHDDEHGQPFSVVKFDAGWRLSASHELLEMLADPFGRRLIAGESPVAGQGRVKFLVEVADPCEDAAFAYSINGIQVSDFYTPNYFDPVTAPGVRYSYTGAITRPRQVLKGGYLTWYAPDLSAWWQRTWFKGDKPIDAPMGKLDVKNGNLRGAIDTAMDAKRRELSGPASNATAAPKVEQAHPSFHVRARQIRAAIRSRGDGR